MKYNCHKRYSLFIGRWQPFHNGHKFIIDSALAKGEDVCIGIRDTEISEKNPYSAEQRAEMIRRIYEDRVKIIVIPDIKSINIGRNVGYDINIIEPSEEIGKISGTNIRAGKGNNVPREVDAYTKLLYSTIWLTGLPCSGKTTLAKRLKEEMENYRYKVVCLDGDDIRNKLNTDLGFSQEDRKENLRRAAHIAKLFNENRNIVIASFVSPTNELREMIKNIIGNFKLVYVKCGLETCEKRDAKGMYEKARRGEIKDFTGISAPFEEPMNADVIIDTDKYDIEACVKKILDDLEINPLIKKMEY